MILAEIEAFEKPKACLGGPACPFVPLKPKEDTAALRPRHCRSSLEMEAANPESSMLLFSLRKRKNKSLIGRKIGIDLHSKHNVHIVYELL